MNNKAKFIRENEKEQIWKKGNTYHRFARDYIDEEIRIILEDD